MKKLILLLLIFPYFAHLPSYCCAADSMDRRIGKDVPTANETVSEPSTESDTQTIEIAGKAAVSDLELGYRAMDARAYAYAVLAFKNAAALSQISLPSPDCDIPQSRPAVLTVKQRSAAIKGIADALSELDFEPADASSSRASRDGERRHILNYTVQQKVADAKMRFARRMRKQERTPLGSAWIPKELEEKLPIQTVQKIIAAAAAACPQCCGTGRSDCSKCKGKGRVKCTNRNCSYGKIFASNAAPVFGNGEWDEIYFSRKPRGHMATKHKAAGRRHPKDTFYTAPEKKKSIRNILSVKGDDAGYELCPVCDGTGYVTCGNCNGSGAEPCGLCEGSGNRPPCRRCHGSGLENAYGRDAEKWRLCERCGGEGVEPCVP